MNILNQFKKELKSFALNEFKNEKYFCIIYGSYCYNLNTTKSDVDFVFVCEKKGNARIKRVVSKTLELHKKFNLPIDAEVPHNLKTISDFKTLNLALRGKGFNKEGKKIIIPTVIKTKKFLTSKKIIMRLLLNALTSKAIFVCGDKKEFAKKREEAFENLIKIIFGTSGISKTTIHNFVKLIIGDNKQNGESFLGYKKNKKINKYLQREIKKIFDRLEKKRKLNKEGICYSIKDENWYNEIFK